jgi:hypothetical protein
VQTSLEPIPSFPLILLCRSAAAGESVAPRMGRLFAGVIAHGDVLERGGREALRAGYHWLVAE